MSLSNIIALYKIFYDKTLYYFYNYNTKNNYNVIRYNKDNESTLTKFYTLIDNPYLIIDNIYLGSAQNSANYNQLKNNNIGLIINVTDEISNYYPNEFEYYNIKILDINSSSLINSFNSVLNTIEIFNKKNQGKNILVHCYMGCSRSASILLIYIIIKHNMNYEDALKYLENKKANVNINITFINEIKKYIKQNL